MEPRVVDPPADVERPPPEAYRPPLRWYGHAWRTVVMLLISTAVWFSIVDTQSDHRFVLDLALGLPAVVLVFSRRRWPFTVAVVTAVLSAGSSLAAGPATLAAVSLATGRRWLQIAAIGLLSLVTTHVFVIVQPPTEQEATWITFTTNVVFISALLAWGMYIGSRRELMWTLRHRAERAEAEQDLRIGQARSNERRQIAREMHDVLAHRISQISMHAGALAFRTDLSADEMRSNAAVIHGKAHEALTDLRGVLGVLRDEQTGALLTGPQPTFADIPQLVDEARGAGLRVVLVDGLSADEPVPDAVGRTLYRIMQEGMTNARKHAPGARLTIEVRGCPEGGITFTMRNPLGFGSTSTPGARLGLVGLSERAELRGGRLEHGRDGRSFVVQGWIPWTS